MINFCFFTPQACPGEAMQDVLCEDLPLCPVNGGWSSWGPWSSCSRTCGPGSTQRRGRKCDMPPPANGGRACNGPESQVRACERKNCPIDGGWSAWGPWSHCSKSCDGGIRRRTRQCNNPTPQFGGAQCEGSDSESMECQENPCPVNGEWSNWSSWSACAGRCGVGIQSRTRTCTEPAPLYGGHLCRGSAKDSRKCTLPYTDGDETCPSQSGVGSAGASWSQWSSWSECLPDCSIPTEGELGESGRRHRTRTCTVRRDGKYVNAKSIRECEGHAEEVEKCYPPPGASFECTDKNRPLFGKLVGEVRGRLGEKLLSGIEVHGNWSMVLPEATSFKIEFKNVPPEHSLCLQVLSEMASPAFWYAAKEIESASNGEYVTIRNGDFTWNSLGQFADSSNVRLEQSLRRVDDNFGNELDKGVVLRMETTINGDCPISLRPDTVEDGDENTWSAGAKVELSDFKEQVVQLDPSKGKLHAFSSRTYSVVDWTNGRRLTEPYGWNSDLTISAGHRQRFLSQMLFVDGLTVSSDPARGIITLTANTAISKVSGAVCPEGFEIVEARMDGRKQVLGSVNLDYCRDVNECINPRLNTCDQVCENTSPGYRCKCHEGYRLSPDGRSCLDIDECTEGENAGILVCLAGQRCINKPGTFSCVEGCGEGQKPSASGDTCENIDECRSDKDVCGVGHRCISTYGGYTCVCRSGFEVVNNKCVDIDECQIGESRCRSNEACVNLPGSFECRHVCPRGYRFVGELAGGVPNCIDIDECATNENVCPVEALCVNEPGSYRCQCPDGQALVGHSCLAQDKFFSVFTSLMPIYL
ncbi:unnamed protein product [Rodentolepis nana]|uniref:EGF-like domain-containing protein n=1 Tax=Rodentolepis nana TaxID=102285 RepID=A0A3P7RJV8_RODNA|nr:unnamed protein product [Rodentolepis nana]